MLDVPEKPSTGSQVDVQGIDTTVELPPVETPEKPSNRLQNEQEYGVQIEALYRGNPDITAVEVAERVGCSRQTATKWLKRLKPEM